MSKDFLIYADGLGEEFWVEAEDSKAAKKLLWDELLTSDQRDAVASLECIDFKET